jgi:hypothetical protein
MRRKYLAVMFYFQMMIMVKSFDVSEELTASIFRVTPFAKVDAEVIRSYKYVGYTVVPRSSGLYAGRVGPDCPRKNSVV